MIMMAPAPLRPAGPSEPPPLDLRWVEDDGLLRDEGVLFGLSRDEGGMKAKEECIRAYYRCRVAHGDRVRAALDAELAQIVAGADVTADPVPSSDTPPRDAESAAALAVRYGLGVVASSTACVGTGVLVYEQLRPAFNSGALVTAGVLAAGFFTASLPVPLLFVSDGGERPNAVELWKVRLAELGLPVAAAVFVVGWAWERLGVVRSLATAALLVLVFAFAGRLLFSSITSLGGALRAAQARAVARKANQGAPEPVLSIRVAELRQALAALPSAAEWDAICEAKLALFRSEFALASASGAHRVRFVPPAAVTSTHGVR